MNACRTRYKGHFITIRWYENGPVSVSKEPRFDAFFRVDPDAVQGDSWETFLERRFLTRQAAVENALAEAQRSVDLTFAAQ